MADCLISICKRVGLNFWLEKDLCSCRFLWFNPRIPKVELFFSVEQILKGYDYLLILPIPDSVQEGKIIVVQI